MDSMVMPNLLFKLAMTGDRLRMKLQETFVVPMAMLLSHCLLGVHTCTECGIVAGRTTSIL